MASLMTIPPGAANRARVVAEADDDTRYVPTPGYHDFCSIAHESRYHWVEKEFEPRGKSVLDFGCGSGYGSYVLSRSAARVLGVDRSPIAIQHASQFFRSDNLAFVVGDASDRRILDIAQSKYDVIVSFDVIEHIQRYFDYLDNARALLEPEGTLIVGCPNRLQTFRWNRNWNAFHVQEFTPYQLRKILSLYFLDVKVGAQDFHDDKKRERARLSNLGRGPSGRWVMHGLRRIVPKFAHQRIAEIRRRRLGREFDHSDIAFLIEPHQWVLERAFGVIAVCKRPRV